MWFGKQKYNKLIWKNESYDNTLKHILLNDMKISVRLLYTLKKENGILVNNNSYKMHDIVKTGDIIQISLASEKNDYIAENIEIKVLYEDNDLLVVEKDPFMVVHPTKGHANNTLANGLIKLFENKQIKSKIRFVNRLDMDTSGILIIAKNGYCHSILSKDDAMHDMKKQYKAIVKGHMKNKEGVIDLPIGHNDGDINRIVSKDGQRAVTRYKVLQELKDASLLEISLETGRTHQIRVHFSHIGHALLGDGLYGGDMDLFNRQALHCTKLGFFSPRENDMIQINSELPQDMKELLAKLKV